MEIPLPYQIILRRLIDASFDYKLKVKACRLVLTNQCRVPKNFATPVMNEMCDKKWITFDAERGAHNVIILKHVDIDMLPRHPTAWARNNGRKV